MTKTIPEHPKITERPRKQLLNHKPINFDFGKNNEYTINTATPDINTNNQANTSNDENINRIIENMENKFYEMSKQSQRKQETQMNQAFDQTHQTIKENNT